jgi:alginate O-acetyltransferase complex protein AlgJ
MQTALSVRSVFRRLPALAFVLPVFLPLMFLGRPGLLGSALSENRRAHDFPKTWSIHYPERLSAYFNDNFGFRNALLSFGSRVMFALGVPSTHPSVVVGRDGWLFYTDFEDLGRATMKDFRGRMPFAPDELAQIRQNAEVTGRALSRCGVRLVLWLVPNKQSIYGEYLSGFKEAKVGRRLDQVLEALRDVKGLLVVAARRQLLAAKARFEGRDLYYRTDTHWNDLGAFVAYGALVNRLRDVIPLPNLANTELARYEIRTVPFSGGDLSANMLNASWRFADTRVSLVPHFARTAVQTAKREAAERAGLEESAIWRSWTNPGAKASVVVYGDSFSHNAIPYIEEHFRRGYVIGSHDLDGKVIGRLGPDLVILQMVERYTGQLMNPAANLDKLCAP